MKNFLAYFHLGMAGAPRTEKGNDVAGLVRSRQQPGKSGRSVNARGGTAVLCAAVAWCSFDWGFFAHEQINRHAVFTLPPDMAVFYKAHLPYLTEASVNPDRRRYAVEGEAPRHYIDLDRFGPPDSIPKYWSGAVAKYGEDTLSQWGVVPWHVYLVYNRLKDAFLVNDPSRILRLSADLGHYVADAHVPLHTTSNYNGQQTGQEGLHAFWETRLPELFFAEYEFWVGRAEYVPDVQAAAWNAVRLAHAAVDSVLSIEKALSEADPEKYTFETRGKRTVKLESAGYARQYHRLLNGMVERQMQRSVKMVGDLWFSAWTEAGQPDLRKWLDYRPTEEELRQREEELKKWKEERLKVRPHENE